MSDGANVGLSPRRAARPSEIPMTPGNAHQVLFRGVAAEHLPEEVERRKVERATALANLVSGEARPDVWYTIRDMLAEQWDAEIDRIIDDPAGAGLRALRDLITQLDKTIVQGAASLQRLASTRLANGDAVMGRPERTTS